MAGLQGRVFGGYQLAEQLSSAGIAEVYKGLPSKPGGREVVVKVIYPEFARQPGFLPRFREIVQATSKLASHPHILPLLASGEEAGYLYLVTPFVAAGTLKDWIGRGGHMGPGDVGPFFRQLCDALTYAHSLGVVHGNVKPSNVFLFEGRHVLLGDFGLLFDVAHLDMDHAGSGAEVVEYLAPEVMLGQPTQQSDVYSVGAVLYATITGQPPFRGARPSDIFGAHARQPVPSLAQAQSGLSPAMQPLDGVIQRAMAKQPAQRFPSATGIAQAIEALLRQMGGTQQAQPPHARPPEVGQPFAPAAPPPALPGGFTPLAPGQLGFGALMAGGALGGAANALGAGVAPSIRPLGPQFPPLPASAMVDESMEQGRMTVRAPEQTDLLGAGAQVGSVPLLPTMRMPASGAEIGSLTAEATMRMPAEPTGTSAEAAEAPDDGAPQGRGGRGIFSLARKRSGLGKRLVQGKPSLPPAIEALDDIDGPAAQAMPAVRGTQAPEGQGFSVIGGTDSNHIAAAGTMGTNAQDDAFSFSSANMAWGGAADAALSQELPAADWGIGLSGEQSSVFELGDESPSGAGWGASGQWGQDAGPRDFSATELGLPRLTHGSAGAPSTWQEILSGPVPAVRPPGRDDGAAERRQMDLDSSLPHAAWRSSPDLAAKRDWGEESAEWGSPNSGPIGWSGDSAPMPAQRAMSTNPWAAVEAPMGPIRVPKGQPSGNRPAPEDDIELEYEEPRGRRRRVHSYRHRPRWIRPVLRMLLLLTLLDLAAVVVLRPDLCPNATCRSISTHARSYLPFLNTPTPQQTSDLSVDPASAKVSVVTGKTTTAQFKVTNNTLAIISWKAESALPWVALTPANGALPAQSGAMLIATVNAAGITPGTYTTTITFTYGQQTLAVPVSINVTAS